MTNPNPLTTLCDNLSLLQERRLLSEQQNELAQSMLIDELLAQYPQDTPEALYRHFLALVPFADSVARVRFCMALCRERQKDASLSVEELFGINEQPSAGAHGKIAYVKNRYNEQAFARFSELVPNAKPEYATDFSEACESVYAGRCRYCVLPIENDEDGRFFRFYAMADRYELKLCAITETENENTTGSVRYALAGRSPLASISRDRICVLEFSLTREDGSRLTELLSAAKILDATPHTWNFLPLEYDHGLYRQYVSFRIRKENASAMALYLSLDYPNYSPIGFYPL